MKRSRRSTRTRSTGRDEEDAGERALRRKPVAARYSAARTPSKKHGKSDELVRVWWPPTDNARRSGFSGMYWPALVLSRKGDHAEVRYDNGDQDRVLTENLQPKSVPVAFGEETKPLQVGEFVEVSNNSSTDPAEWVGVVVKANKKSFTVSFPFHSADDETVQEKLLRRARVWDEHDKSWLFVQPYQDWEDGDVTSPVELYLCSEEQLFARLGGDKRKIRVVGRRTAELAARQATQDVGAMGPNVPDLPGTWQTREGPRDSGADRRDSPCSRAVAVKAEPGPAAGAAADVAATKPLQDAQPAGRESSQPAGKESLQPAGELGAAAEPPTAADKQLDPTQQAPGAAPELEGHKTAAPAEGGTRLQGGSMDIRTSPAPAEPLGDGVEQGRRDAEALPPSGNGSLAREAANGSDAPWALEDQREAQSLARVSREAAARAAEAVRRASSGTGAEGAASLEPSAAERARSAGDGSPGKEVAAAANKPARMPPAPLEAVEQPKKRKPEKRKAPQAPKQAPAPAAQPHLPGQAGGPPYRVMQSGREAAFPHATIIGGRIPPDWMPAPNLGPSSYIVPSQNPNEEPFVVQVSQALLHKPAAPSEHVAPPAPAASGGVDGGAAPKRKRHKDPHAPQRPPTAYVLYINDNRERIKAELGPEQEPHAVTRRLSQDWRAASAEERRALQERVDIEKARYEDEMRTYKPPPSPSDSDDEVLPRPKSKPARDKEAPQRPRTAYLLFSMNYRKGLDPSVTLTEATKQAAVAWKNVDPETHARFTAEAANERAAYEVAKRVYDSHKASLAEAARERARGAAERDRQSGLPGASGAVAAMQAPPAYQQRAQLQEAATAAASGPGVVAGFPVDTIERLNLEVVKAALKKEKVHPDAYYMLADAWRHDSPLLGAAFRAYRLHIDGSRRPDYSGFLIGIFGLATMRPLLPGGPGGGGPASPTGDSGAGAATGAPGAGAAG